MQKKSVMIAVDKSVRGCGSMSLLVDGRCVCQSFEYVHPEMGFDSAINARSLLGQAGLSPMDVTAFAVGLGPGSYAGVRSSLAFANGMSMPSGATITGVPSAAAAALSNPAFFSKPGARLAVAGDARRGTAWVFVYERTAKGVKEIAPIRVVPYEELEKSVPDGADVSAVDLEALEKYMPALKAANATAR